MTHTIKLLYHTLRHHYIMCRNPVTKLVHSNGFSFSTYMKMFRAWCNLQRWLSRSQSWQHTHTHTHRERERERDRERERKTDGCTDEQSEKQNLRTDPLSTMFPETPWATLTLSVSLTKYRSIDPAPSLRSMASRLPMPRYFFNLNRDNLSGSAFTTPSLLSS